MSNVSESTDHADVSASPRPFALLVENTDRASPNLLFNWTLNEETVANLRTEQVRSPFLFLVVAEEKRIFHSDCGHCTSSEDDEDAEVECKGHLVWNHLERQLLPLDQGMGRVEFHRAGTFTLFASVLWERQSQDPEIQQKRDQGIRDLTKKSGESKKEFYWGLDPNKSPHAWWSQSLCLNHVEKVDVTIDASLFAPSKPRWLMFWVDFPYKQPSVNECQFWKRVPLAVTLQPATALIIAAIAAALYVLYVIVSAVYALSLLFNGWRFIRYRRIVAPNIDEWIKARSELKDRGYFPRYAEGAKRQRPMLHRFALTPWTWMAALATGALIPTFILPRWDRVTVATQYAQTHLISSLLSAALIMLLLYVMYAPEGTTGRIAGRLLDLLLKPKEESTEERIARMAREQNELETYYRTRVQPLSILDPASQGVGINALPTSHRTRVVRWMDLNTRTCKPFQIVPEEE